VERRSDFSVKPDRQARIDRVSWVEEYHREIKVAEITALGKHSEPQGRVFLTREPSGSPVLPRDQYLHLHKQPRLVASGERPPLALTYISSRARKVE